MRTENCKSVTVHALANNTMIQPINIIITEYNICLLYHGLNYGHLLNFSCFGYLSDH